MLEVGLLADLVFSEIHKKLIPLVLQENARRKISNKLEERRRESSETEQSRPLEKKSELDDSLVEKTELERAEPLTQEEALKRLTESLPKSELESLIKDFFLSRITRQPSSQNQEDTSRDSLIL